MGHADAEAALWACSEEKWDDAGHAKLPLFYSNVMWEPQLGASPDYHSAGRGAGPVTKKSTPARSRTCTARGTTPVPTILDKF